MRHAIAVAIPSLSAALFLCGCETSCSFSTATLAEAQTAIAIHPETQAPTEPARTFSEEAQAIYAAAKLSSAPDGTKVKATFHYLENGENEIASNEIEAGGERWLSFTLSPAATGWPLGQYEVRLYLNGDEVDRLPFNVAPGTQAARAAAPLETRSLPADPPIETKTTSAAKSQAAHKKLLDDKFAMELELPASWSYRITSEGDYLIEAPGGEAKANQLYVLLQFISKAHNPGSSAVRQAEQALAQISQAPDVEIKKQEMLDIAGQEAPYFVATYTATGIPFGHTQIVMEHGEHYYWLGYVGPTNTYEENAPVFQHIVETFRFTED
jgi:hypothetical protein